MVVNRYPDWSFNQVSAEKRLCATFGTGSLQAFSLAPDSPEIPPAGLLLEYLELTAGAAIHHVTGIRIFNDSEFVSIDDSTRKNLELVQNLRDGGISYSLFEILNQTRTAMGARLLRNWIQHPLTDRNRIESRLADVSRFYHGQKVLSRARELLADILDVERLAGRIAMERAHGKDLVALRQSLGKFAELDVLVRECGAASGTLTEADRAAAREVFALIDASILDDCPVILSEGGIIRDGWSPKLDELRSLRDNSNAVLEAYLAEERSVTGIQNLKIRYNRLIGYFLEVSKGNLSSVPAHFIRRRSLANGDRYTTDRLVELETELNGVHANIIECEQALFLDVRKKVFAHLRSLLGISREIARLDVLQSFAQAATVYAWTCPVFSDSGIMEIVDGRHPVVEAHIPSGEFVPNSITLSSGDSPCGESADAGASGGVSSGDAGYDSVREVPSFALITGPNMAGKSTFLRQTALIALMAQTGSFVPASRALLTPVDRIFCRVGASDNLARGESTFLVEMTETARILRSATRQSLVIMDEVGRGTSTEDGLSIARAVTEYLLAPLGAKTLFATHYHELSRISHPRLAAYCLDVLETEGTVVFLKKVREGASANSYGIHVARLAGVPEPVLVRAREILASFTDASTVRDGVIPLTVPAVSLASSRAPSCAPSCAGTPSSSGTGAGRGGPGLFSEEELVLEDILSLDTDSITPLEALQRIARWKKQLFPAN
jgi:DNA mismatch repair protein MutS